MIELLQSQKINQIQTYKQAVAGLIAQQENKMAKVKTLSEEVGNLERLKSGALAKAKQTVECGMASFEHKLPADTAQADLIALIDQLNADPLVDGILVQLPLPGHLDEQDVVERIDPNKDVDGLTPISTGRLALGLPLIVKPANEGSTLGLTKVTDAAPVILLAHEPDIFPQVPARVSITLSAYCTIRGTPSDMRHSSSTNTARLASPARN